MEAGLAGGVVLWQAGALCDRSDAGPKCVPIPLLLRTDPLLGR